MFDLLWALLVSHLKKEMIMGSDPPNPKYKREMWWGRMQRKRVWAAASLAKEEWRLR